MYLVNKSLNNIPPAPSTIAVLFHDGAHTQTWNGVTLNEGESIADIVERIVRTEGIERVWSGNGRERVLTSLLQTTNGEKIWKYYINNTTPSAPIGKYFPKPGDVISLIYEKN